MLKIPGHAFMIHDLGIQETCVAWDALSKATFHWKLPPWPSLGKSKTPQPPSQDRQCNCKMLLSSYSAQHGKDNWHDASHGDFQHSWSPVRFLDWTWTHASRPNWQTMMHESLENDILTPRLNEPAKNITRHPRYQSKLRSMLIGWVCSNCCQTDSS